MWCGPGAFKRDCRADIPPNATDILTPRCEQWCTNYEGTFQCSCDEGLAIDSDGHACLDMDECFNEGNGNPCLAIPHARCMNVYAGVNCVCEE